MAAYGVTDIEGVNVTENYDISISNGNPGAKIDSKISVINIETGKELVSGRDYTIAYINNKALGNEYAQKPPTITIKGKDNYSGSWTEEFSITPCDMSNNPEVISIVTGALQYSASKNADFVYRPRVTVKDGKSSLGSNDITVEYVNCDQQSITKYLQRLADDSPMDYITDIPHIIISAVENGTYVGKIGEKDNPACVLNIFRDKLSASNVYIVVDNEGAAYTGAQCRSDVTVYKAADSATLKAIKGYNNYSEIMVV